jgi:hypothetical protein
VNQWRIDVGDCRDVLRAIPPQATNNTTAGRVEALARPHGQRSRLDVQTLGFEPSCSHGDGSARGVVLDPFAGAGTTGLVALQHGREFVGIELSPEYAAMARERIETTVRLGFRSPQNGVEVPIGQGALFDHETH